MKSGIQKVRSFISSLAVLCGGEESVVGVVEAAVWRALGRIVPFYLKQPAQHSEVKA